MARSAHLGARTALLIVTAASIAGVVAACIDSGAEPDDRGEGRQAVIGGQREASFGAAGYLLREGVASCSAVLIEPDLVLTAAHCVDGHQDIAFGWGEVGAYPPVRSIVHAVNPRYINPPRNGGVAFQGFDAALLRLERPAEVEPAPLGTAALFEKVRAIGYGATSYESRDGGGLVPRGVGTERRSIEGEVRSRNATEVFVRFDVGMSACYGDSGGPLFSEDGTVIAVLSRFTELGRCAPKDRSLMGYIRVDTLNDFFREARVCMNEPDVQGCLREPSRGLCAKPRFDNDDAPTPMKPTEGDLDVGSEKIELIDGEQRALTFTPGRDVVLALATSGDARLRVTTNDTPEPIRDQAGHVDLDGGKPYRIVLDSCNEAKQTVALTWRPRGQAERVISVATP